MNDDFKVTYTNHSKAYVPKLSGTDVYRSYLNLLPEDEEKDEVDESKKSQISEERKKILGKYLHTYLVLIVIRNILFSSEIRVLYSTKCPGGMTQKFVTFLV